MEVTALCIRLLMNMFFLLCALDQKVGSVSLRIIPNKLQLFEYESLSFICEGLFDSTGWRVVHQFKGEVSSCKTTNTETSAESSCTVKHVYSHDSGEYWCEDGEGKKSDSVNITVTGGSVILESPVLPVMEGETVSLRCRSKTTSNFTADFYKDDSLIVSSSTGHMTIHRVSKSVEGLYKCKIIDVGESPASRLTVRETHPSSDLIFVIFRNILPIVLMVLLLLLLGLCHCGNLRANNNLCPLRGECNCHIKESNEVNDNNGASLVTEIMTKS